MKITKKKIVMASVILILLMIYIKGCAYLPISGTVVEAETGKPIEGAVVLAEWTITRGAWIGLSTTGTYKVTETITDKEGKFKINSYIIRPFINKPRLTIYKAGYVCWNNEYIFPGYKHRTDFKWENGYVFKIEQFKEEVYSHKAHMMFIYNPVADSTKIPRFYEAIRWERVMMQKEIKK